MRALVVEQLGGPEVLQLRDVPVPQPGAGQVRVKVEAVGINFADVLAVRGEYLTRTRLPMTPGMEFAGSVDALGEGVMGFSVGQRVAVLGGVGGLAEFAVVPAGALLPVPESLSAPEAAAFPVSYLTAFFALSTLGYSRAGEWVVVQAAAGALGTASVQLAKSMGLNVIALASSDEKLQVARDLGADVTFTSDTADLVDRVREATGGRGANLVLEVVGGKGFQGSLDMLAPRGRVIVIGAASREPSTLRPVELMKRNLTVTGLWLTSLMQDPEAAREAVAFLTPLLASGQVRPQVGPTYALAETGQAFEDLLGRRTTGKVIIEPQR